MVYNIFTYRRPSYVKSLSIADSSIGESTSELNPTRPLGYRSGIAGIPPQLSFDRIIDGGTCPVSPVRALSH
jgi:hypothetical protein